MDKKSDKAVIMPDSPEAAKPIEMTLWKSRTGKLYADEEIARSDGATHTPCARCGKPSEKWRTLCPGCENLRITEKYEKLEKKAWDGEGMICMFDSDRFFSDLDEAGEYAADHEMKLADLRLVICESRFPREVDPDDFYCEDLPEDYSVEDCLPEIAKAFKALNAVIRANKTPISYWPGRFAVLLPETKKGKA